MEAGAVLEPWAIESGYIDRLVNGEGLVEIEVEAEPGLALVDLEALLEVEADFEDLY